MMIEHILRTFHLNDKQIKIIKKLLDLGTQPASHLAMVCEMPRNTVRSILDELVKQGLLVKTNRANTQYYSVEKKERIIKSLQHRKVRVEEEIDAQISLLENFGDELTQRHLAKSRPKITFYEGTSGLEKVYEDTLSAKEGIKSWASFEGMEETLPEYFKTYFSRRAKKNILMKSIHPDTERSRTHQKKDKQEMRQSCLIPMEEFNWVPEIQIYNDRINITSWKEKLGIIIESPEISQALSKIFDLSWIAATDLDTKKPGKLPKKKPVREIPPS